MADQAAQSVVGEAGAIVHQSPTKEAVRIIPFLSLIEVETSLPAIRRFINRYRFVKSLNQRRHAGHTHVGQQPIDQNRNAAKGSPEVRLSTALELPGRHLDKDDVRGLQFGKDAVTEDLCSRRHERQLARIAVVNLGGSDPGEPRTQARRLKE